MRGVVIGVGWLVLLGQAASAQVTFEVASVKPSGPAETGYSPPQGTISGGPGTSNPERITYSRVPMRLILLSAFGLKDDQIKGPDWVLDVSFNSSQKYDIVANVPPGTTKEQANVMMQNLLKQRFKLAFRVEKSEFDVYELSVAKGGAKLKDAEPPPASGPPAFGGHMGADGWVELPAGRTNSVAVGNNADWRMTVRSFAIAKFLSTLEPSGFYHVVDKTGLTGKYDFKLEFSLGGIPQTLGQQGAGPVDTPSDPVPDLFTALEKQLGLKLVKTKASLDLMVIDHIDKIPVGN